MSENNRAPGRLSLVQDFVNTLDVESGQDEVGDPSSLEGWLTGHGLLEPGVGVDEEGHARALSVREALRELMFANHDSSSPPQGSLETLDLAAARAPVRIVFLAGAEMVPVAEGTDRAIGILLTAVAEAMANGTWSRLKACAKDSCRWSFYDHARNRSGKWCSMAVCGNRVKATNYRRKQQEA
jgi:predicted RNA-binding Zn ribbon-like protein